MAWGMFALSGARIEAVRAPTPTPFGSVGEDQQPLVLPTLALSPPALDHVRRDERQASEDREPLWLAEAVAALKDEPRERPEEAGEGSQPLVAPTAAPPSLPRRPSVV